MADACGAKTRSGGECKKAPLKGKTRCKLHGGASKGPPSGSQNALKHGIYADLIPADELRAAEDAMSSVGGVENELMVSRLQLRRALRAQSHADTLTDGMEVFETVEREGASDVAARSEVKKKLRDYPQIINVLLGRIESLEKTRAVLLAANGAPNPEDLMRDDTFIAPDEGRPDAPIL